MSSNGEKRRTIAISACVITKNEERNLGRWLDSMRQAADELIVVDTGSTDRTVALAEAAGARVFHFAWRSDFAAAKNYAIEQARGRWILFLDADEYFTPETVGRVRPLLHRLEPRWDIAGVACRLVNIDLDDGGRLSTAITQLRMFRNNAHIRYKGAVHEALTIPPGKKIELVRDVEIYHTGYSSRIVKEKMRRNLRILQERAARGEGEPMDDRYFMDIWYGLGDYAKAIAYAKKLLAQPNLSDDLRARAYETWASACTEGAYPVGEAIACLQQAVQACPDRAEFPLMLGLCQYGVGAIDAAEENLRKGLAVHAGYASRMDETSVIDNAARLLPTTYWRLGEIAEQRGDLAGAQDDYVTGLQMQPRHAGLLQTFWRYLRRVQAAPTDAIAILNAFYDKEKDAAFLARILAKAQGGQVYLYYARLARARSEREATPVIDYLAAGRPDAAAAEAAECLERLYGIGLREAGKGHPQPELLALMPAAYREQWEQKRQWEQQERAALMMTEIPQQERKES